MNDYKITFERSNGTIGNDTFTAKTEQEARRDFNICYRHGTGTIISVEIDKSKELEFVKMLQTEGYDDWEIEQIITD